MLGRVLSFFAADQAFEQFVKVGTLGRDESGVFSLLSCHRAWPHSRIGCCADAS